MPRPVPPSRWDLSAAGAEDGPDDVVGFGADLAPGTLLAAYQMGLFPMPSTGPAQAPYWFSPPMRGVLTVGGLHISRSLSRTRRRFEIRVDTAFGEVLAGCADPSRPHGWIDEDIATAFGRLHDLGWAHSVEAWREGRLVGGLYGVAIGGLFAAESKFSRETDASKAAVAGLIDLLRDEYADRRVVDVQWQTPHLASLGVIEVPRADYRRLLADALKLPLPAAFA